MQPQDDESMQLAMAMSLSEQTAAADHKKNAVEEVPKIIGTNNFQMLRSDCGLM